MTGWYKQGWIFTNTQSKLHLPNFLRCFWYCKIFNALQLLKQKVNTFPEIKWPMLYSSHLKKSCLVIFSFTPAAHSISNPLLKCSRYFSLLSLNTKISSKYPKRKGGPWSTSFINCYKCVGGWAKPKGTFLNSNFSIGITEAYFFCTSGVGAIWL